MLFSNNCARNASFSAHLIDESSDTTFSSCGQIKSHLAFSRVTKSRWFAFDSIQIITTTTTTKERKQKKRPSRAVVLHRFLLCLPVQLEAKSWEFRRLLRRLHISFRADQTSWRENRLKDFPTYFPSPEHTFQPASTDKTLIG